ncbi:MAG: PAS domain S-box protein [Polyangiaceae bacterium]|nr:PAS domain S-box protein [Polyangiaceae bacterium]
MRDSKLKHELEVHQIELEMQNEELRRTQAELEESRDRYYELFDLAPVPYVTLDAAGRILECNLTTADLLGVTRARLLGRPLSAFMSPDDADRLHRFLKRVVASTEKKSEDFELHTLNQHLVRTHIEAIGVPAAGDRPFACRCVMVDLSALHQAENRLRETEERFRQFAEAVDDVFYARERDGRFSYVNAAFVRAMGMSVETLYETDSGWSASIDPDDVERYRIAETRLLQEGRPYDIGYRIRRRGEVRFLRHRAYPVFERDGRVKRTVGIVNDVTLERELEEQLRHAQKMEAVGALASGVAHDFNNVLQSIIGLGWMALKKDARPSEVREHVEAIVRTARRGGAVAGRLTSFARRGKTVSGTQEIDVMVQEVSALLTHLLTEDITVELSLDAPGAVVNADAAQLEQILMNLAANARDAMPHGGKLLIQTSLEEDVARLVVTDTGGGMDAATLARIFEPFFTTKCAGRGTGLGLASVKSLIQQLGGRVEVRSALGQGTTVRLELPLADAKVSLLPPNPIVQLLTGKVLLVEDEPIVRMTIRRYLEELGLDVVEASNGEEGRRRFAAEKSSINLLVTDVVMPGMLGTVLAGLLQASKPDLRVLFMTANPQNIVTERSLAGRALLRKPFNREDLAAVLGELLLKQEDCQVMA